MKNINLLLLFILPFLSCEKTPDKVVEPKILWRSAEPNQDGVEVWNTKTVLSQNKVIAANHIRLNNNNKISYYIYDKTNGTPLKEIPKENAHIVFNDIVSIGNFYLECFANFFRIINLEDYSVNNFKIEEKTGVFMTAKLTVYEDDVFMKYSGGYLNDCNAYGFYKSNVKDKFIKWEKVMDGKLEKMTKCKGTYTSSPSFINNKKGDKLMVYSLQQHVEDSLNYVLISKFEAYNLTTNKIQWSTPVEVKQNDSEVNNNSIVFHNGIAVMSTSKSIQAYDIETGDIIWQKNDFASNFSLGNQFSINGYLIIQDNRHNLYKIDILTGKILKINKLEGAPRRFVVHKDVLYYKYGLRLFAVDLQTLNKKWSIKIPTADCPNCVEIIDATPIIDPESNLMYLNDGREMFCIKLPE
jgi:outer membrane protein assembly factor BamB